jgi:predicted MFS family arabinose efflux permease
MMGSGAMAAALFLHGMADTYASLLSVRALAGAAGGMLSGAAVAYVGDYFPYHRRGWANGWIMSGIAFGQIIGIPAGTIIADQMGFRWPFLLFAFVMTLSTIMIWRFVPQPDVQLDPYPLSIRRAIRNYVLLVRDLNVAVGTAVYFLMFFSVGLYVIYLPTWLESTLGVGGEEIASLFLVGGLASVVSGPMAGRLSDRVGRKPLIVFSCAGLGIAMLMTTYVVTSMWTAYAMFAVSMIMVGMRISPLQSLMSELVTAERRGILMSLAVGIGQIGIGISGAVAGFVYSGYGYLSSTLMGAAAILFMAFLVRQFLPEPDLRPARDARLEKPGMDELAAVTETTD